jgi:hypothetical protein
MSQRNVYFTGNIHETLCEEHAIGGLALLFSSSQVDIVITS